MYVKLKVVFLFLIATVICISCITDPKEGGVTEDGHGVKTKAGKATVEIVFVANNQLTNDVFDPRPDYINAFAENFNKDGIEVTPIIKVLRLDLNETEPQTIWSDGDFFDNSLEYLFKKSELKTKQNFSEPISYHLGVKPKAKEQTSEVYFTDPIALKEKLIKDLNIKDFKGKQAVYIGLDILINKVHIDNPTPILPKNSTRKPPIVKPKPDPKKVEQIIQGPLHPVDPCPTLSGKMEYNRIDTAIVCRVNPSIKQKLVYTFIFYRDKTLRNELGRYTTETGICQDKLPKNPQSGWLHKLQIQNVLDMSVRCMVKFPDGTTCTVDTDNIYDVVCKAGGHCYLLLRK